MATTNIISDSGVVRQVPNGHTLKSHNRVNWYMQKTTIVKCRKVLFALSVVVFITVFGIIAVAFTPSGDWVKIEQSSPVELTRNGADINISFSIDVTSVMPYEVSGMDISLSLVDHNNGSYVPLYSENGITIAPHSTTRLDIDTSIWLPSVALVFRDMVMKDGVPLHLDLIATCGYLGGLTSFRLVSEIDIPVTAEGEKLSFATMEDTDESFVIKFNGLADWLIPKERTVVISGGNEKMTLSTSGSDGVAILSMTSESGLDGVLNRITSADDFIVESTVGFDIDPDMLRALDLLLQYMRGM